MITEEADETHARRLLQCDIDDGNSTSRDCVLTFPSIILAANVADMSATCDTVTGFCRHGALTATQNRLTVPTFYVGISIYVGRYTLSDDIFAKCVDMSPTCHDIRHFRGKFAPPSSRHDTADICS
jgi:hypothetical protein